MCNSDKQTAIEKSNAECKRIFDRLEATKSERQWVKEDRFLERSGHYIMIGEYFESIKRALVGNRKNKQCLLKAIEHFTKKRKFKIVEKCRLLIKTLRKCSPDHPCGSAACQVCSRKYRAENLNKYFPMINPDTWKFVTLIFADYAMGSREFYKWTASDLNKLKKQLYDQLRNARYKGVVFGGFDINYSTDAKKWIPHFHLFFDAANDDPEKIREYMRREGNLSIVDDKKIYPMRVDKYDGSPKAVTYAYKAYWMLRIIYNATSKKSELGMLNQALSFLKRHEFGFKVMHFEYGMRKYKKWTCQVCSLGKSEDS